MINIRKSLSSKLSLTILVMAIPIFVVSLGVLFTQSRRMIRSEAVERTQSVLGITMQRLCGRLLTVETATNAYSWIIKERMYPDSLLMYTDRIVRLNSHIDGCSVSMEPNVFPEHGRYYSVYTIREGDSIISVVEQPYEYFGKVWYKAPKEKNEACWVDFYDETDSLEVCLSGMVASYCKPIHDSSGKMVAVISTDVSLRRFLKVISEEKPYPNSYFMMLDTEGHYIIHPDSTRLFTASIFDGADPHRQADLIALGHEMTTGNQGNMALDIDGVKSLVTYQPVPGTSWCLALVCPDADIMAGYHKQTYILLPLLFFGLLIILVLCHKMVTHTIRPLNQLLEKTRMIASGNMEVYIPRSERTDTIGRLQNSFASMLQRTNFHMGSVRYTTEQTRRRNKELMHVTRLAEESEQQKTAFIQNVSHQIRTPLNILMGFSQVIRDTPDSDSLPEEEMNSITKTMDYNAKLLNRMVMMLFDSSDTGFDEEKNCQKQDKVSCNEMAREALGYVRQHYPDKVFELKSDVDDGFCICTNHLYLMRSLRELLYNSGKYSEEKYVSMRIVKKERTIRFIVEDKGKGIAEAERERMFTFFAKIDDLSEGLGLGLPLSKRHALTLGGDLTIDTDYQDGCRFILELPCTNPE